MSVKDKYNIADETWQKLWKLFKLQLWWHPLVFSVLAGCLWAFFDKASWLPAITVLWLACYLLLIVSSRIWLVRAKFTILIKFIMTSVFEMVFIMVATVGVYELFGMSGLLIQSLTLLVASIFFWRYFYAYWGRVWASHEIHNETVVLDLENGRYDYLNSFRAEGKKYSNPNLTNIVIISASIGAGIALIFKSGVDILLWVFGVPLCLYWIKMLAGFFYHYKKLSYYEEKIGKPIINGLLADSRGKKVKKIGPRMKTPKKESPTNYAHFLMNMEQAMDEFIEEAGHFGFELDFSEDTLDSLEQYYLKRETDLNVTQKAAFIDSAGFYFGETFRNKYGGSWAFTKDDHKDFQYEIPIIIEHTKNDLGFFPHQLFKEFISQKKPGFLIACL